VLRLRVLSALVGVPILIALAVFGGSLYVAATVLGGLVASLELFTMLRAADFRPVVPLGLAFTAATILAALATDARIMPAILVLAMVVGLLQMMARPDPTGALIDWALTLSPVIYVGGTMHYLISLRALPDGLLWVLILFGCTWICDISAFFVGRRWGNRRLAPRISPGKSVEGAIGGLLGAILAAMLLGPLLAGLLSGAGLGMVSAGGTVRLAGLGLVVGVCAIIGDLMESFIKRQCGAKDSGALIPGHGGILDRIDSVLVAAVGAYFYVVTTS
jgi:phosphatidate cytidylyltransferase